MINKFMVTTALATISTLACLSFPAQAEVATSSGAIAPSLTINGNSNVNVYFGGQRNRRNGRGGPQPAISVDGSDLFLTIMGRSPSGIEYSYKAILQAFTRSDPMVTANYIQFKGCFGTVQLGGTLGPEDFSIIDAGKIIGGTGGFDGNYRTVYNMSAGVVFGDDNIGDTGGSNKIVYISPEMMGWVFSVAYTPSTSRVGDDKIDNQTGGSERLPGNRGLYEHKGFQPFGVRNIAIGFTYKKEIGKWSLTLSGAGVTDKSYYNAAKSDGTRIAMRNTNAYQLGAMVGYGDWRVAGGWLDNGKSRLPKDANFTFGGNGVPTGNVYQGNAGKAWNLGAGYTMGAYQFGLTYQRTDRKTDAVNKASSDVISASADATFLQGLKGYAEVNFVKSRTNATAMALDQAILNTGGASWKRANGNNSGTIAIIGTKVSF